MRTRTRHEKLQDAWNTVKYAWKAVAFIGGALGIVVGTIFLVNAAGKLLGWWAGVLGVAVVITVVAFVIGWLVDDEDGGESY